MSDWREPLKAEWLSLDDLSAKLEDHGDGGAFRRRMMAEWCHGQARIMNERAGETVVHYERCSLGAGHEGSCQPSERWRREHDCARNACLTMLDDPPPAADRPGPFIPPTR